MASPTSSGSEFQIEIRLTKDGELVSRLKGVQTAFTRLGTTSEEVMKKLEDRYNNAAKGSKAYYDAEISHLRTLRDTTATTIKQTREYDARIASLEKRKAKLNQAKRGSINYYKAEIKALREEQRSIAISSKRYKELELQIRKYQGTLDLATKSQGTVVKTNQHMISNAGLAGATLTEFGRTISDANYGIRGMANNLSQLSTLFITLVAKTDGAKNAFKLLLAQLNGPMGYILAFQVLVSLVEAFSIQMNKSKDGSDKLSSSLKEQNTVLRSLSQAYLDSNDNLEKREGILRAIKQIDEEYYNALRGGNVTEEERNKIIETRNNLITAEIRSAKNREEINKKQAELNENLIMLQERRNGLENTLTQIMAEGNLNIDQRDRVQRELLQIDEAILALKAEDSKLSVELMSILSGLTDAQEKYKDSIGETTEASKQYLDALQKSNISLLQQKIARIQAEEAVDQESAERQVEQVNDLKLKILEINRKAELEEAKEKGASIFEISNIEEYYRLQKEILEANHNTQLIAIKKEYFGEAINDLVDYNKNTFELEEEAAKKRIKLAKWAQGELAKANAGVQEDMMADLAARGFDGKVDKPDKKKKELTPAEEQAELVKQAKKLANSLVDALNAQYDAEISIEEAKTARINNELKKRLNNEQLSAEQREKINAQIAANEEALQKKRDEIAEKNFKLQKAVQIAQTMMSTFEMAADAFGTIKGMKILGPAALPLAIAAATTATTFGLAQVDAIRRQQFVPSAISTNSSSSSTSGPSVAVQAPDFNIVGQSQTSQLAELVSGQLDRPVKAYVVSKDISTAQELDRNKIDTAAL